jgi:aerobic carbon-monoxide dehydrogenase small subunit
VHTFIFSIIYGFRRGLHSRWTATRLECALADKFDPQAPEGPAEYLPREGGNVSNVSITVNGRKVNASVEDRTLLVYFLRENLGLTGTHVGCDTSQCGACVVHVDGKAVKSCTILAAQADGSDVLTIEGLAGADDLHPVQIAFKQHHGLQCGFCTPGMIMAATDMIARHPEGLDEATVRAELEGNICRCTGYHNIVKAILAASEVMSKSKGKARKAA